MSNPNLLGFSSSVGIYRNKRIRDLRQILVKECNFKVPFADMAVTLFQIVMAYAAENQIDGDFSRYTPENFVEIFATNNVSVSVEQAAAIRKAFGTVGLFDEGKIRSWHKFNRHFAEHEKILRNKRRAGKLSRQKWERRMRDEAAGKAPDATKNGDGKPHKTDQNTVQKPAKNPSQNDSPSKQLWVIEQALKSARGKAKKELNAQKEKLLSQTTGVDLSPAPAPPPSPAPSPAASPKELTHEELLESARYTVSIGKKKLLTNAQREALKKAGEWNPVPE